MFVFENFRYKYLVDVVDVWNKSLKHDQIDEHNFKKKILYDDNFNSELSIVLLERNADKVIGFGHVFHRMMPYYTKGLEKDKAWLYILFIDPDYQGQGLGKRLYLEIEKRVKNRGCENLVLSSYSPSYLTPGIDERYSSALSFFTKMGFELRGPSVSMKIDLERYNLPDDMVNKSEKLLKNGVIFRNCETSDFLDLKVFVQKHFSGGWTSNVINAFRRGIENKTLMICELDDEIIGYSQININDEIGRFGPIGINESFRGKGLGGVLLHHTLQNMKARGYKVAYFEWTSGSNISFYSNNGFEIARQYKTGNKLLGGKNG